MEKQREEERSKAVPMAAEKTDNPKRIEPQQKKKLQWVYIPINRGPRPARRRRVGPDPLSAFADLPYEVLDNVFSFLPIRNAIQTSLMTPRFKDSWLTCRNLNFDREFSLRCTKQQYVDVINGVLSAHAGPKIDALTVCLDPAGVQDVVENWIKQVTEKEVEVLHLNFLLALRPFHLSPDLIEIKSLTSLTLINCNFIPPSRVQGVPFLTNLVLWRVNVTSEFIKAVFANCSILETLELVKCHKIRYLNIEAYRHENFRGLRVGSCSMITRIFITAPSLQVFHYCGTFRPIKFGTPVHNLRDVTLNFSASKGLSLCFEMEYLVGYIPHVMVFSTTSTFLEGLSQRVIDGNLQEMPYCFLNLKEFHLFMEFASYCNAYDIACFLKNCPFIEEVFIDLNDFTFAMGSYWEYHQRQELEKFDYCFSRITFVKILGFRFDDHELELVKLFLQKAPALRSLILVTPRNSRVRINVANAMSYRQSIKSWRAGSTAYVAVIEPDKDTYDLNLRHFKSWYQL